MASRLPFAGTRRLEPNPPPKKKNPPPNTPRGFGKPRAAVGGSGGPSERGEGGFGLPVVWGGSGRGLARGCSRMRSAPVGTGPPTASSVLGGKTPKKANLCLAGDQRWGVLVQAGTRHPKFKARGGGRANLGTALSPTVAPRHPGWGRPRASVSPRHPWVPARRSDSARGGTRGRGWWHRGPRHAGTGTRRRPRGRWDGRRPSTRPLPPSSAFFRGFFGFCRKKSKIKIHKKSPKVGLGASKPWQEPKALGLLSEGGGVGALPACGAQNRGVLGPTPSPHVPHRPWGN